MIFYIQNEKLFIFRYDFNEHDFNIALDFVLYSTFLSRFVFGPSWPVLFTGRVIILYKSIKKSLRFGGFGHLL